MLHAAEQELLIANVARRNSADAYCKEEEKHVPLHSRRNTLEYATKGTYCDPHLQNRNVKLCSHQPSPKETIWFSGIRLDRLSNVPLFFGVFIYSAVQCFALFNHQQLSLCGKLCQLCFIELARRQKKLSRSAFAFSWETAPSMAAADQGLCLCGWAPRSQIEPS